MRAVLTFFLSLLVFPSHAQSVPGAGYGAFGAAVAASGDAVFVGEPGNTMRPGTVYVYANEIGPNATALTSSASFIGDQFGSALAASGTTLLVSAPAADSARGAVFVFDRSEDGSWIETAVWPAPPGASGFGSSLALYGSMAVVGAPESKKNAGLAFVYEWTPGGWTQTGRLADRGLVEDDRFGTAVAVAGERILVGAPGRNTRTGDVFVFALEGATWTGKGTLDRRVERGHRFGSSIAADQDLVLVGAPMYAGSVGGVFTYMWDGAWEADDILTPFVAERGSRFGTSLALAAGEVWIGAPGADQFEGAFFAYTHADGRWTGSIKQQPDDAARGQQFGSSVAAGGDLVVAGLPGADAGTGSALVFSRETGEWVVARQLSGPTEGYDAMTGQQVPCTDGLAGEFGCEGVDMESFTPVGDIGGDRGVRVNDVWGWVDPQTGREYALVGRTDGTSFVDVTDHRNPVYIGNLSKTADSPASSWRDIKVYMDHAYIVADGAGSHGMQVFDLRRLRGFDGTPIEFDVDTLYDRIHSAHNIVINEDSGFGYAVGSSSGGETCGGGLHMIDLHDPQNPVFAGCFSDPATGRSGTGYTHDAQCVIYHGPDSAHQGREICFNANETALSIADVTEKDSTVALSSAAYPNVGYAHQGWLTEDHRYFYLDDELDELSGGTDGTRTLIWDVTDLEDPQLVKEHISDVKASDHNMYVRGHFLYQSNYVAGLRILDIADPANPVEVAHFDTVPYGDNAPGFNGSWSNYPFFPSGSIIVTSGREGLFVLKKREIDL